MIGLFFDTETTGFPSEKNPTEIVQIAAVLQRLDGNKRILGEINFIVKPSKHIPQEVVDIHGINDELAARFGLSTISAEILFMQLLESADVAIAHNIDFDTKALRDDWPNAHRLLLQKESYCTMLSATPFDMPKAHAGKSKWPKLSDAFRFFFGNELDGAHDAMVDVRACRDVYFAIQTHLPRCITCEGLLNEAGGHEVMPADRHQPLPYPKLAAAS